MSSARRSLHTSVVLLVLFCLVVLAGYIYSPWHQHQRSSKACPFAGFEHGVSEQPGHFLLPDSAAQSAWLHAVCEPSARLFTHRAILAARAPPVPHVV